MRNNQNVGEHSRPTAWAGGDGVGYGDAGGGILHIAELSKCAQCTSRYIQVKISNNCNTRCHKFALSRLCLHFTETQRHV